MLTESQQIEYDSLSNGCGVVHLLNRTIIEITGDDRASFLHNLCTNEVKAITPGTGNEAFVTNVQGKTIGHVVFAVAEDRIVLHTVPGQNEFLINHLDRYLITEDVNLVDKTNQVRQVVVAGRNASEILKGAESLWSSNYQNQTLKLDGTPALVQSVPYISTPSLFCTLEIESIDGFVGNLLDQGAASVSEDVFEIRRIENGFPLFGKDIAENNLPQEIDRDQIAISFTKGCYLGQETVARLDALGHVNKKLMKLQFDNDELPAVGDSLCNSKDESVGVVTSACWSPDSNAMIGLGMVRCKDVNDLHCNGSPVQLRTMNL